MLAHQLLSAIPNLRLLGPSPESKTGIVSFVLDGIHAHDIAHVLNHQGIAVRAGQHCAMPLHQRLGHGATTRASFYLYNTSSEVEELAAALQDAVVFFKRRSRPAS
jgi:cysteine desulfurase/selenocysteine lyase